MFVEQIALALALTAVAGYVDACGFLTLHHLFVSFMSGNSTQVSVAVAYGSWGEVRATTALIGEFVIGVCIGHALSLRAKRLSQPLILLTEAAFLVLGISLSSRTVILSGPIVLAMGLQNAVLRKAAGTKTNLTYVTGTLVHFGEKVVDALWPGAAAEDRWAWLPYLALWAGLVAGAGLGAWLYRSLQLRALFIPVAVLLTLAMVTSQSKASRSRSA